MDNKAVKSAHSASDEGRGAASTLSVVVGAKCYRLVRDNQYPHFLIAIAETSVDGRG